MGTRGYLAVTGTLFGAVCLFHLLRVVNGWNAVVGPWSVPMWISWLGTIVPAVLCAWALRLASSQRPREFRASATRRT